MASEPPSGSDTDFDSPPPEADTTDIGYSSRSMTELPAQCPFDVEDDALARESYSDSVAQSLSHRSVPLRVRTISRRRVYWPIAGVETGTLISPEVALEAIDAVSSLLPEATTLFLASYQR